MTKRKTKEVHGDKHIKERERDAQPDVRIVYTVAEVAKMLTLSTSTVRRLIKHDLLRAVNTHGSGGRVLISYEAIKEFLGERKSA